MIKLTVKKQDILEVLAKVQSLTGRKSNLAITSAVLIQTRDDCVVLTATDLETGFEGVYPAQVTSQGSIAINSKKLFEIIRDFPEDEIVLEESENRRLKIGNHHVVFNIVGMDADDFPEIPQIQDISLIGVDASAFRRMIEQTIVVSSSSEEKREHIIGALLENVMAQERQAIRMVSTDSSRLNKVDYISDDHLDMPQAGSAIIPKKALGDINKFLDADGMVDIGLKDSYFIFKRDRETIIIRLLEGDFPQYADIIAKGEGYRIILKKQATLMMLKRMSILSSDQYRAVIFNLTKNQLTISSTNPDLGESKEDLEIDYDGPDIEVAFNPRYFIDALSVIHGGTAVMSIADAEHPCFIEAQDDASFLSVIMPMRI